MSRISVIGTGFIAKGLIRLLQAHPTHTLEKILTRTDIDSREDLPQKTHLTNKLDELIQNSDLIVECTGDAIYAAKTISKILDASIPVVTMNAEFHVTVGSYFVDKGLLTEAEGDQPGVLAMLHEEAIAMGFKPLVYGNMKGFLNHDPVLADMEYWGKKQGFSTDMTTSFTDGTKVEIEQALVANGLKTDIFDEGILGLVSDDTAEGGRSLAEKAKGLGRPVADYLLSPTLRPGVFITAEHDSDQQQGLSDYKMGDGPFYVLDRPYHLCYFEIIKTIDRVLRGGGVLLNNSEAPTISAAAIAKRDLSPGLSIKKGIGSFEVRGVAVRINENIGHIPIGLLANAIIIRPVKKGDILTFDDVEIPDSLAYRAWKSIEEKITPITA